MSTKTEGLTAPTHLPTRNSDYGLLGGQRAWPARAMLPPLAYAVSCLQQKLDDATIGQLRHANTGLSTAKGSLGEGHLPRCRHVGQHNILNLDISATHIYDTHAHTPPNNTHNHLGIAAVPGALCLRNPAGSPHQVYALCVLSVCFIGRQTGGTFIIRRTSHTHRNM